MIEISKLDKAEVLAALYNNARQQGLGVFAARGRMAMTKGEAAEILREQTDFDYLYGRVLKVDLSGDAFEERLYDRDNGPGAAEQALSSLPRSTAS